MANDKDAPKPPKPTSPSRMSKQDWSEFVRKVFIVYGIGVFVMLALVIIWYAAGVFLVVFAAILLAVLLNSASRRIERHLRIPYVPALALVTTLIITVIGVGSWLMAPQISQQLDELMLALPNSIARLQFYLARFGWLNEMMQKLPPPDRLVPDLTAMIMQARVVFTGAIGAVANFFIILFVAIYLAAYPRTYINGVLKLFPKNKRQRGEQVFDQLGATLRSWLVGKLFSMIVIGTTTAIGLSLLGVPLSLTLGLVMGILDFIPYLGPIMAGIPAILMAFTDSPQLALYVLLLLIGLQAVENYLLQPLVERRTVSLPPALTITMQVILGVAFGLMGVALASPLTAVICVLIGMLYVEGVLGDRVTLPGEANTKN